MNKYILKELWELTDEDRNEIYKYAMKRSDEIIGKISKKQWLEDKKIENSDIMIKTHKHASYHKDEILSSKKCGCFFCCRIFTPIEIYEWIENRQTALCPYCGIDSVIGDKSGYNIDETFLIKMEKHWFNMEKFRKVNKKINYEYFYKFQNSSTETEAYKNIDKFYENNNINYIVQSNHNLIIHFLYYLMQPLNKWRNVLLCSFCDREIIIKSSLLYNFINDFLTQHEDKDLALSAQLFINLIRNHNE